jgi:microcystin-dependent protein
MRFIRIVLPILLALLATEASALDLWRPKGAPSFVDEDGAPIAGKLCYFDSGTTNARTVYKDRAGTVPWTQPIALDSSGRLTDPVYVPLGTFKEVFRSADATDCNTGTTIFTADDLPGSLDTSALSVEFAKPEQPASAKASDYTVQTTDLGGVINVNATGGPVTITLPSAVTAGNGGQILVRKIDSSANAVTINVTGAATIDGQSSHSLVTQHDRLAIGSDGSNWYTLAGVPTGTLTFPKLATTVYDTDTTLAANSNTKFATQAAVKSYVDAAAASGFKWKDPVRIATTANAALATAFENGDTIDGTVLATGNRILLKDQTAQTENGIYTVNASGAPTRATDADDGAELTRATVYVQAGTANIATQFTNTNTSITVGSTNITFSLIAAGTTYTAGTGLQLSGQQFSVANDGIGATQIATGAVGAAELATNAVGQTAIVADAVTYAKIQDVSATDRFLGRDTAAAGDVEEISGTAAGIIINGADPNADRISFWDDSASGFAYLAPDATITISGTTLSRAALTGDVTAPVGSNTTALSSTLTERLRDLGEIITTSLATCPSQTLWANGAAISRTTYSALFAVMGTMYGVGNGSTTFNLPDYRGEFLRSWANGSTNDPDRASRTNRGDGTTGDNVGTKQADEFGSHTHDEEGVSSSTTAAAGPERDVFQTAPTNTSGAAGGNETRPRNVNVLHCIYVGA